MDYNTTLSTHDQQKRDFALFLYRLGTPIGEVVQSLRSRLTPEDYDRAVLLAYRAVYNVEESSEALWDAATRGPIRSYFAAQRALSRPDLDPFDRDAALTQGVEATAELEDALAYLDGWREEVERRRAKKAALLYARVPLQRWMH